MVILDCIRGAFHPGKLGCETGVITFFREFYVIPLWCTLPLYASVKLSGEMIPCVNTPPTKRGVSKTRKYVWQTKANHGWPISAPDESCYTAGLTSRELLHGKKSLLVFVSSSKLWVSQKPWFPTPDQGGGMEECSAVIYDANIIACLSSEEQSWPVGFVIGGPVTVMLKTPYQMARDSSPRVHFPVTNNLW